LPFENTGLELKERGTNYYVLLNVSRSSSPLEIKRAYKKLSLQLHPDKNPSPNAADQFDALKQSYDVLMDMELREVYDKFGAPGIKANKRFNETQFLLEVAVYYVTYGMLAFVLTWGRKSGDARNWIFTGLLSMLVIEVALVTSKKNPIPNWLAPQITEYDAVWLLHSLFPAFLNGCRSLGSYLYVDLEMQTRQFLLALSEQNKDLLLVLREIQIGVQTIQLHGGGGSMRTGTTVASTANASVVTANGGPSSLVPGVPRATPTGKLKELQDRLRTSNATVAQAVQQLKGETKSNGQSNMGFYLMILGYIVVSYMFS
jgi:curved DNA-binding protein CbpA